MRVVTGSPGGRTIPNTTLWVVLNLLEFGLEPRAAVDAPRTHHQWFPDVLVLEGRSWPEATRAALLAMGHRSGIVEHQGIANTIVVDPEPGGCTASPIAGDRPPKPSAIDPSLRRPHAAICIRADCAQCTALLHHALICAISEQQRFCSDLLSSGFQRSCPGCFAYFPLGGWLFFRNMRSTARGTISRTSVLVDVEGLELPLTTTTCGAGVSGPHCSAAASGQQSVLVVASHPGSDDHGDQKPFR